jgi:hypothetical protein
MEACTGRKQSTRTQRAFENLIRNEDIRHEKDICSTFVQMNKGATNVVLQMLQHILTIKVQMKVFLLHPYCYFCSD